MRVFICSPLRADTSASYILRRSSLLGVSAGSLPRRTKKFSDSSETFTVCKASEAKNFCRKSSPSNLCLKEPGRKYFYHKNPKIGVRVSLSSSVFKVFFTKECTKNDSQTLIRFLSTRLIHLDTRKCQDHGGELFSEAISNNEEYAKNVVLEQRLMKS